MSDRSLMIEKVDLAIEEAREQAEFWAKELRKLESLRLALSGDSREECWATREYRHLFGE